MPVYRIPLSATQIKALNAMSQEKYGKVISVHSHVQTIVSDAIAADERVPVAQNRNADVDNVIAKVTKALNRARDMGDSAEAQLLLQTAMCYLRLNMDDIKLAEKRQQVDARTYQSISSSVRIAESRLRLQLSGSGLPYYEKMAPGSMRHGALVAPLVSTGHAQPQGDAT